MDETSGGEWEATMKGYGVIDIHSPPVLLPPLTFQPGCAYDSKHAYSEFEVYVSKRNIARVKKKCGN